MARASLDLTEMGVETWKEFVDKFNLGDYEGQKVIKDSTHHDQEVRSWLWENEDGSLRVSTCNNPITGKYRVQGGSGRRAGIL
jgi:hypothetical protein